MVLTKISLQCGGAGREAASFSRFYTIKRYKREQDAPLPDSLPPKSGVSCARGWKRWKEDGKRCKGREGRERKELRCHATHYSER